MARPDRAGNAPGKVYFPRWPVIGALLQWAEFTGNASIAAACVAWTHVAAGRVAARTPPIQYDWTGVRMQGDWLWLNHWLNDRCSARQCFQFIGCSAAIYHVSYVTQTLFLSNDCSRIATRLQRTLECNILSG